METHTRAHVGQLHLSKTYLVRRGLRVGVTEPLYI